MAATIIAPESWPDTLRREKALSWIPDFQNQAGPQGLDGTRQYRNTNGGGLWRCHFNGEQLFHVEHVRSWLGMEVLLRGGITPVNVPLMLWRYQPAPGAAITSVGGWAARAITGTIHSAATIPLPGMHFSDFDGTTYGWRLHRIASAVAAGSDNYTVTFWPPARFAVVNGHALETENCKCVMRLATTDSMDIELEQRRRGNPNAEFEEAF